MSAIRAVFFDFGDTLAELSPSREELFVEAARWLGLELDRKAVLRAYQVVDSHNKYSSVHHTDRERFYQAYNERLCEMLGISSYSAQLCPLVAKKFREGKKWILVADASETLHQLHERGTSMALVANWDANLAALADALGIRHFFTSIVSSQVVGMEKPDPGIFRSATAELSLSPESDRILYVGNEYRADVVGSRTAGLTPVLIDRAGLYPHADCLRFASLRQWMESMG